MATGPQNQIAGKGFEKVFETLCRYQRILPIKSPLAVKQIGLGRFIRIKGPMDYELIHQGEVAHVDTKSWGNNYFTHSQLDADQMRQALIYNEWGIQSGFVSLFRKTFKIVYYNAVLISRAGPGTRFTPEMGLSLGTLSNPALTRLFLPAHLTGLGLQIVGSEAEKSLPEPPSTEKL